LPRTPNRRGRLGISRHKTLLTAHSQRENQGRSTCHEHPTPIPLLRVPVTGRHPAVAKLVWVIFGRSGRVSSPHSDYRSQFVFFTFQISSTHPLSPPPAGGGLSSLLLGGYVPMQNPGACANRQSLLQGPRFGLVGVDFGWEGSPTTFGSLIHFVFSSRKKGQPLCLCLL